MIGIDFRLKKTCFVVALVMTEILNRHSNRRRTRGSKMSDVRKCPKCGGEMQKGSLFGFYGQLTKWTNKESGLVWRGGNDVSAFLCKNCGYIELYMK